jgi:hypothetical protein
VGWDRYSSVSLFLIKRDNHAKRPELGVLIDLPPAGLPSRQALISRLSLFLFLTFNNPGRIGRAMRRKTAWKETSCGNSEARRRADIVSSVITA